MNPGYLSLLLIVVSVILIASGWKDVLIRGITRTSLLLFFMGWLLGIQWTWESGRWELNAVLPVLAALFLGVLLRSRGFLLKLHLLSVGLLLGSVHFFLKETLPLAPMLVLISPEWTTALLVGLLGAVLLRSPTGQIGSVTLGLLLGEAMDWYAHKEAWTGTIGGALFQDGWWLTVYAVRTSSMVVMALHRTLRSTLRFLWHSLKGGRE
ncbi:MULTISPECIES: YphA family membrane protein [Paenibacillus]|uniref:YphA family membrane protein n=1 Tax=Paenibacillus TaxID=44249 RepID=UPI0022B8E61F|nr:hypothetical protein [Paenibacillus caseinilyticus]MCZ8520556.1 hypothetical protein [Paenibacillus caseinilyticus]